MTRTQFEDDIHLIAAPIRHIRNLLVVSVFILIAPVLLIWLIIGSHLEPENVGIAKFPIGVFGPMVFSLWFAGIVRWIERHSEAHPRLGSASGGSRASGLAAYFCSLAYVGVLLSTMFGLRGKSSVWAMVLGLFSPAIFYVLGRVFNAMWIVKVFSVGEILMLLYLLANGFGFLN